MAKSDAKQKQPSKLIPLYDRVLVRRDTVEEAKESVIIIPDSAQEKLNRGTVVACGEGRISDLTNDIRPMRVVEGDKVIFGKFTGDEFELEGQKLLIMREDQIYGIVKQ